MRFRQPGSRRLTAGLLALGAASLAAIAPTPALGVTITPPPDRQAWLLFPVDVFRFTRLSSNYGWRTLAGKREFHSGLDVAAPSGSWIAPAREGTVERIGYGARSGWYVKLRHAHGWRTVYCHMREDPRSIGLQPGATVRAGQAIGRVGSTGRSTGPHLHFGVYDGQGRSYDPLRYLFTPHETWSWLRPMLTMTTASRSRPGSGA